MRSRVKVNVIRQLAGGAFSGGITTNYSTSPTPNSWVDGPYSNIAAAGVVQEEEVSYLVDHAGHGKRPKDCRHYKVKYSLAEGSTWVRRFAHKSGSFYAGYRVSSSGHYALEEQRSMHAGVARLIGEYQKIQPPGVTVTWPSVDDRKIVQALFDKARKPVVDSILNLYESPEIPSALTSLTSYGPAKQRNWKKIVTEFLINKKKYLAKKVSVDVANKYLAYSFGIAPLISDINKVRSYLDKIEKDYAKFRDRKVRRISLVFRGDIAFSMPAFGEYTYQGYASQVPTVRYVLTYRERNPYSSQFITRLDFLIRRFGTAGPATFAWERIPFSFVVDWFIDTSSIIDYLDTLLQGEQIEVISLTKSQSYTLLADCFRTVHRSDTGAVVYNQRQGNVMHRYYDRSVLGKSTYVDFAARFGKKQAALSVALLRQKLKKL